MRWPLPFAGTPRALSFIVILGLFATPASRVAAIDSDDGLPLEDRIRAQRAIEEVYNRHRTSSRPLDEVMPPELLEHKVRSYLEKSAALRDVWRRPITPEALDAEVRRLAAGTRMPDRLREVFDALGNDPLLIRECLARPLLADRMEREIHQAATPTGAAPLPALDTTCQADDTWTPTALPQATIPDFQGGQVIWTGNEMLVFAGSFSPTTGGVYEPTTDTWTSLPVHPLPVSGASGSKGVWTGAEVIFWGGFHPCYIHPSSQPTSYLRFNPFTGTWGTISAGSPYSGLFDHSVTWTGTELIIWGGNSFTCPPDEPGYGITVTSLAEVVRYDPRTGTRTTLNVLPARAGHTAVWTGTEVLIYGGYQARRSPIDISDWYAISIAGEGRALNPAAGTVTTIPSTGQPSPRHRHTAVWSGDSMLVWGGDFVPDFTHSVVLGDGGAYDRAANTWSAVPVTSGSPSARGGHAAAWTGSEMIIWNGPPDRARYDPASSTWTPVSMSGAPCPETPTTAFWTGHSLLSWGCPGQSGGQYALYQSSDRDGDGLTFCQGDCDDTDVAVHPGAAEACNLVDDDCDGALPAGEVDADRDGFPICGGDCRDDAWEFHPGAQEVCDSLDGDCDGLLPPGEADLDQDGYMACDLDCDDTSAAIRPGVPETCDGLDNNCNGSSDEGFADSDADGRADCSDCQPSDPYTWAAPPEVANVQIVPEQGDYFYVWDDLSPGTGISVLYDVFAGSLAALRQGSGDFSIGSCQQSGLSFNAFDLSTLEPPAPGDGAFIMVRGQNSCGIGTYGSALRDQTAAASPLACP